ncbi:MAG: 2-amino-4-hydroxy-6-hydroxymethyldihydropteridine diphosphokinase, partial [Planctomycetota bacterium]
MGRSRITAAIALGANVGEPERSFKRALSLLERDGDVQILRRSHWHGTDAVGGPASQPDYMNGAVLVETTLTPGALLDRLHGIEAHLGRDRANEEHRGPRVIDLDLLYALDGEGAFLAEHGDELRLPHPRLEERPFVLAPLKEIAPAQRLSRSGRTVAEQLDFLEESGGLARFDSPAEARA